MIALPLSGRELIWNVDGLSQYLTFFIYEGEWIRGIVSDLFAGNGLNVPLWEWHSGYGTDVPTTFDVFFDPLNLLSAITPPALSEWVFQLIVVIRMYLAGLAFTFYARTRGEGRTGTVFGALLYALCGTGLVGVRWASGLHAFILFPIILAGAERILSGKKPWVFVASLTALAVISYYFTFSAAVLLVGYLVVRVVMVERPNLTAGRFFRWVGIFAGWSLLSAALAAFSLVPAAVALLGMDRFVEGHAMVPLFYTPEYYIKLLESFLSTNDVVSDVYIGYGGLAFLACIALFACKGDNGEEASHEENGGVEGAAGGKTSGKSRDSGGDTAMATNVRLRRARGKNFELKLIFVILTAFFLIPAVGSFFNGMNYATNRWAWAYTLCVAFILTRMTPSLLALDARGKRVLITASIVYAVLFLLPNFRTEANVAGYVALLVALMVLVVDVRPAARRAMLGCALSLTLIVNGFYLLSPEEGGQGSGEVPLGAAYAKLTTMSANSVALDANDDTWWRYDAQESSFFGHAPSARIANNSLILGLYGIDFYNSVYNSAVDAFHTELAIASHATNFHYLNVQSRADLMALLGVKYYAYRNDGTDAVPYGFDMSSAVAQRDVMGVDYRLVPTTQYLPIGFAFDKAITREEYLSLTPVQRQQALLQAVVLDDEADSVSGAGADIVGVDALSFEDEAIPFTVESSTGVTLEDGRLVAHYGGSSITLACEGASDAETYLYIDGLRLVDMKPSQLSGAVSESKPWYYHISRIVEDLTHKHASCYELSVTTDASPATAYIFNVVEDVSTYGGKNEWLASLGYSTEPVRHITISFSQSGAYKFKTFEVLTQGYSRFADQVETLAATPLEDVELGCNRLTGSIDMEHAGTLLITTANADGWTAYVDGEPADLLRVDTAFTGLNLPAGQHDIELRYFTPGLAEGFAITGVAVVVLVVLALVLHRRQSRYRAEGEDASAALQNGGREGNNQ